MKFRDIKRVCAAVLAGLMLTASAQAEGYSAIVTSKSMMVYADEEMTWELGSLDMATVVTVESESDDVSLISLDGHTGYASSGDLASISSLASPVTITENTYVFQSASLSSKYVKVKKGMQVNLLATSGAWAMVENNGVIGYMNKDQLKEVEVTEDEVVVETFLATVTASKMKVYKSYSTASLYLGSVAQGVTVTVHAYNSTWAYIELNGNKGYARIADMKRTGEDTSSSSSSSTTTTASNYLTSDSYTVEQKVYLFLTREMGLNTAAACGILANIQRESSFRVTAASSDGGYGLVQWTGSRNTRLKNWCTSNGYDYATVEGQMWYLKYELENYHTKTLRYLKNVENTAAGAYDAGYYFCYYFEIPASRAKKAVERGNIAKETYWIKYAA